MKNVSFLFSMVTLAVLAACSSDPASVASDSTQVEDSTNVTASGFCLKLICPTVKPGSLDTSFGQLYLTRPGTGKVTTDFQESPDFVTAMAFQNDGKIVATGRVNAGLQSGVARYNRNGSLDSTFGTAGKATTKYKMDMYALGVQSDGKIVLAGQSTVYVDGSPTYRFALVRLNPNGSEDATFGSGVAGQGVVETSLGTGHYAAYSLVIQADGKIVVAGSGDQFIAVRYNPNGSLDNTFGAGGIVRTTTYPGHTSRATSMVLQSNGKIVVAGFDQPTDSSTSDMVVVRYNANGSLDTRFDGDGIARVGFVGYSSDYANAVKMQSNGKIVLAGYSNANGTNDFAVARLNSNGSRDTTFGSNGILTTPLGSAEDIATGLGIQRDGKIVVGGSSNNSYDDDFAVVRYNTDGSLDSTFGIVTTAFGYDNDIANALGIQTDGKIVLAGRAESGNVPFGDFALARYNP
jgi:uncharacterized delta-60 repeat protein